MAGLLTAAASEYLTGATSTVVDALVSAHTPLKASQSAVEALRESTMALEARALLDLIAAAETTPALRGAIRESTQTAERAIAERISAWSPAVEDNYERAQLVISLLDGLALRAIVNPINDALANRTRDMILAIITE